MQGVAGFVTFGDAGYQGMQSVAAAFFDPDPSISSFSDTFPGLLGYAQFEYANEELTDMFALADIAISRAGANSICELLALHKPNILIPLSAAASRGDQVLNANSFKKQGFSYVIEEENLTDQTLLTAVKEVYSNKDKYIKNMSESGQMDSISTIISLIKEQSK